MGLLFTACGVSHRGTKTTANKPLPVEKKAPAPIRGTGNSVPVAVSVAGTSKPSKKLSATDLQIKKALDMAYQDWQGIPYVIGGSGYTGVDCSALMQIVFEDYFEVILPRNTKEQLEMGKSVKRSEVKIGDMVFFKTGRKTIHVGIMMGENEFMHASTSNGVIISRLDEIYWASKYYTARRVL